MTEKPNISSKPDRLKGLLILHLVVSIMTAFTAYSEDKGLFVPQTLWEDSNSGLGPLEAEDFDQFGGMVVLPNYSGGGRTVGFWMKVIKEADEGYDTSDREAGTFIAVGNGIWGNTSKRLEATATRVPENGNWHYYTIQFDNNGTTDTARIYRDGDLIETVTGMQLGTLTIGSSWQSLDTMYETTFSFVIDDLSVWTGSGSTVLDFHNDVVKYGIGSLPLDHSSLDAYWDCDSEANSPPVIYNADPPQIPTANATATDPNNFRAGGGFREFVDSGEKPIPYVRVTVESDYGDTKVSPAVGLNQDFDYGSPQAFSAPEFIYLDQFRNELDPTAANIGRAYYRLRNTGYTINGQEIQGGELDFLVTLDSDLTVVWLWELEYAVIVDSVAGGLADMDDALGNAEPLVGKTWAKEGSLVSTAIDGIVYPSNNLGLPIGTSRFRSQGYILENVTGDADRYFRVNGDEYWLHSLIGEPGNQFTADDSTFTIEFWARRLHDDATVDQNIVTIGFDSDPDKSIRVGFRNSGTQNNSFFAANNSGGTDADGALSDRDWHHWAAVNDGSDDKVYLYRDGKLVHEEDRDFVFSGDDTVIGIGIGALPGHTYTGDVNGIRIWNVVRTEDELRQSMFVSEYGPGQTGLLMELSFDSPSLTPMTSTEGNWGGTGNLVSWGGSTTAFGDSDDERLAALFPGFQHTVLPNPGSRVQVPEFVMNDWVQVSYLWGEEYSLSVKASDLEFDDMPFVLGDDLSGGDEPGEYWVPEGSSVTVGTYYRTLDGDDTLSDVLGQTGIGRSVTMATVVDGSVAGRATREYTFDAVTGGGAVVFFYGDTVYRAVVALGDALNVADLATANLQFTPDLPGTAELLITEGPTVVGSGVNADGQLGAESMAWDNVAKRLFPVVPGSFVLNWQDAASPGTIYTVELFSGFPGDTETLVSPLINNDGSIGATEVTYADVSDAFPASPAAHYRHLVSSDPAKQPPVSLDANNADRWFFREATFSSAGARTQADGFAVSEEGKTVLLFGYRPDPAGVANGDENREALAVRIVESFASDGLTRSSSDLSAGDMTVASFDTTDHPYIRLHGGGAAYELSDNASRTIEFWCRLDSSLENPADNRIIYEQTSNPDTDDGVLQLGFRGPLHPTSANVLYFDAFIDGGAVEISREFPNVVTDNDWHHWAIAVQGNGSGMAEDFRLFQDGRLVAEFTEDIVHPETVYDVRIIGASLVGPFGPLGEMDNFRMWGRTLTTAEVRDAMDRRTPTDTTEMRYSLFFDDGADPLQNSGSNPNNISVAPDTDPLDYLIASADGPVEVSSRITSKLDTAGFASGYSVNAVSNYNSSIYLRGGDVGDWGPLYPVNWSGLYTSDMRALDVAYYENPFLTDPTGAATLHPNVAWPYTVLRYDDVEFPTVGDDKDKRIYISSRIGSEGADTEGNQQLVFDPASYDELMVYNQPDRDAAGYNANEEHALVAPSIRDFLTGGAGENISANAAFALQNQLNRTDRTDVTYSSEPWVLVQYRNLDTDEYEMAAYKVETRRYGTGLFPALDSNTHEPLDAFGQPVTQPADPTYDFEYPAFAGDLLIPPYPLNLVVGNLTMTENSGGNLSDRRALWFDINEVAWVVSGDGQFVFRNWYPMRDSFWFDLDNNGAADIPTGTPLVWLPERVLGNALVSMTSPAQGVFDTLDAEGLPTEVETALTNAGVTLAADLLIVPVSLGAEWTLEELGGDHRTYRLVKDDSDDLDIYGADAVSFEFVDSTATEPGPVLYNTFWREDNPVLKRGESITYAGGENKAENFEAEGLPAVVAWAAGEVIFDSLTPKMAFDDPATLDDYTARIIRPLDRREYAFAQTDMPTEMTPAYTDNIMSDGGRWYFKQLTGSFQKRFYYDSLSAKLVFRGRVNDLEGGDPDLTVSPISLSILEPNIMTVAEYESAWNLASANSTWTNAVDVLFLQSQNPHGIEVSGADPADLATPVYYPGVEHADTERKQVAFLDADLTEVADTPTDETYQHLSSLGTGAALVPNPSLLTAPTDQPLYVTLVENNHVDAGGAVSLHVIEIGTERFRGAIKLVEAQDVFDEKVNLRHTGDFGANTDGIFYQWWVRDVAGLNDIGLPGITDTGDPDYDGGVDGWQIYTQGLGLHQIAFEGNPQVALADKLFYVRYGEADELRDVTGTSNSVTFDPDTAAVDDASWRLVDLNDQFDTWARADSTVIEGFGGQVPFQWAGASNSPQLQADGSKRFLPQLIPGWIKRVLDRINPYEARFSDFYNNDSPATYSSMLQVAGKPFIGKVALNSDKNVIENVGLIELYETVLARAKELTLDQGVDQFGTNQALLLATTRLSLLYELLAREAYSDAQDSTIRVTDSNGLGTAAPFIHAFQNQEASLLHEELALLRGTDFLKAYPAFNRLFWNYVKGLGEAAYNANYNIHDVNEDGFINEFDAAVSYPQGHGDSWGHFLSANKMHYELLQDVSFTWASKSELYSLLDNVIEADFLDEKTFARIAAAKARAGNEIVKGTYRQAYTDDPEGQWQGYSDVDEARAWGVAEWSKRAGQAAHFDWIIGNALVPADADTSADSAQENLDRIDRRANQAELGEIAGHLRSIQLTLDQANSGLNPLGVDRDALVFDMDPLLFDGNTTSGGQKTHFEQIYERALGASANALAALEMAGREERKLRRVADDTRGLQVEALRQDTDYRNRLIEFFGTPYDGTIGPGQIYEEGYIGPDTLLYLYIDRTSVDELSPAMSERFVDLKTTTFLDAATNYNDLDFDNYLFKEDLNDLIPDVFESVYLTQDFDTQTLEFSIPVTETADYALRAPQDGSWGHRQAYGRVQTQLNKLLQEELALKQAKRDYSAFVEEVTIAGEHLISLLEVQKVKQEARDEALIGLSIAVSVKAIAEGIQSVADWQAQNIWETAKISAEVPPKVAGTSVDGTSSVRAMTLAGGLTSKSTWEWGASVANATSQAATATGLLFFRNLDDQITRGEEFQEIFGASAEVAKLLTSEESKRLEIGKRVQGLHQISMAVRTAIDDGLSLLDEREAFNMVLASKAQRNRYADIVSRLSRNEALGKYQSAFDHALRYAWLAAKAYDYETGLDPGDPAAATTFLEAIVKERSLGLWAGGEPRLGQGGLAEILAQMKGNFDVLEGQLGINNPKLETGRLSMRHEFFRIKTDDSFSSKRRWREALQARRVENIWDVPEFRKYCRPFGSPADGDVPALVIPFGTEIFEGKNVFGRELGGGDHAYSPTNFATKIRSVGVWFEDYNHTGLATTPRVYLVPVGSDVLRLSTGELPSVRSWNVMEQRIPVPFLINQSHLTDPGFIPSIDSVNGSFAETRRFGEFRAYHDGGGTDPDQMTTDSRLIGRSVWNTRWLLIIRGTTLHSDGDFGLDTFVDEVSDIKLQFETYSHEGL